MLYCQLKHTGTVYAGRVGARMRMPKPPRPVALTKAIERVTVLCSGGPFKQITLTAEDGPNGTPVPFVEGQPGTLTFRVGKWHGYYTRSGVWVNVNT